MSLSVYKRFKSSLVKFAISTIVSCVVCGALITTILNSKFGSRTTLVSVLILVVLLSSNVLYLFHSSAGSSLTYSEVSDQFTSAYNATLKAEASGANVSSLVDQLNTGLALFQLAQALNSTDPPLAVLDLNNASNTAQSVAQEANVALSNQQASQNIHLGETIGEVVIIAAVAAALYVFGERVYALVWVLVYRNYRVKSKNE